MRGSPPSTLLSPAFGTHPFMGSECYRNKQVGEMQRTLEQVTCLPELCPLPSGRGSTVGLALTEDERLCWGGKPSAETWRQKLNTSACVNCAGLLALILLINLLFLYCTHALMSHMSPQNPKDLCPLPDHYHTSSH